MTEGELLRAEKRHEILTVIFRALRYMSKEDMELTLHAVIELLDIAESFYDGSPTR